MRKYIVLFLVAMGSLVGNAQSLYDLSTIQNIEIVFAQSNWDAVLDAERAGADGYVQAQSVTINGTLFDSVGVKFKGNSSYNPNQAKNPFHIELDTYKEQDYQGYKDIKLSNVIFDPSFVREALSYKILRNYMHAPQANFATVTVNGTLIGLYTNVESIGKTFVDDRFGSKSNSFFSCSPPAGASPQSNDYPSLEYLGTNVTNYVDAYEIKSDSGWNDLIELTDILKNNTANIESVLDVDRALWMLAFDNLLVNLDSYIGRFKQNYYLYQDDNGRFNSVVWDLNMSFGVFGDAGSGPPLNTNGKRQLSHVLHSTDVAWPLVQELLAVDTYKKRYLAHYKTILTEMISSGDYLTEAQTMQSLIGNAVAADPNKFNYQSNIANNLSNDVSMGMNTAPGLTNLMNGRNTYLSGLADFTATQPAISNVAPSVAMPVLGGTVSITAEVTNANTSGVFLASRSTTHDIFVQVPMFDDGNNDDGIAGDGVYGAVIPVNSSSMQYYIYAENNDIGAFSPARAEHEFYSLSASVATIAPGDLAINEIMASNDSTASDDDGEFDDWFELYNNSTDTLSLDNLFASDKPNDLYKWAFPAGLTIAPNSYLIVWADEDLTQTGIHADFKFSAGGEALFLSYADSTIVDSVTFGAQTTDMGYARIPNGTGSFVIQSPTFNANNELALGVSQSELLAGLVGYPNPATDVLNLKSEQYPIETVTVYNLEGRALYRGEFLDQYQVSLDFSSYAKGVYLVEVNQMARMKIVK